MNSIFSVGQSIQHFRFGEGIIRENDGSRIIADFPEYGARQLGTSVSVAKGIISSPEEGYAKKMEEYKDLLMNEEKVRSRVVYAEKELDSYAEFLE